MRIVYTTADDDRVIYDRFLPREKNEDGSVVFKDDMIPGRVFVQEFELPEPQIKTSDTRNAARRKVNRAIQNDPLYTTLSDYKPYVEKLKEDHAHSLEAQKRKPLNAKIQVPV